MAGFMGTEVVPADGNAIETSWGKRVHDFIDNWKSDADVTIKTSKQIGATAYCDQNGTNCFDSVDVQDIIVQGDTNVWNISGDTIYYTGNIGAVQYCDENGESCFNATDISN